jgi:predicted alpha/beta-hydrolase family hydrolase
MAERLVASGRQVVLYNFPYTEARRKIPDPPGVLEASCAAVAEHARRELGAARLVHGGKSMGGRIASQAVAKGAPADALLFLGYPLHPPGRPETLRDRHLSEVAAPMLFLQGTRDSFARWDLIAALAERLGPRATLHRLEGADHSFRVPRAAGRSVADVEDELAATMIAWLAQRGL